MSTSESGEQHSDSQNEAIGSVAEALDGEMTEVGGSVDGEQVDGEEAASSDRKPVAVIDLGGAHFFEVRLDVFDGPIDLLLHLVKQNELSIEKISLAQVASQYLTCIEAMRYFDLEVAGEYLVIAATLLSIKSSILLNEPPELIEDELGNLVNPHDELLQKLREAAVYRDGAKSLESRDWLNVDVFAPAGALDGIEPPPVRYQPHDSVLLARAFRKVLERLGKSEALYTVTVEHVSIVERMRSILDRLEKNSGRVAFQDLFSREATRGALVGSFVAILELCKRQVVKVEQGEVFDEIYIVSISQSAASEQGTLSSEFDEDSEAAQPEVAADNSRAVNR